MHTHPIVNPLFVSSQNVSDFAP